MPLNPSFCSTVLISIASGRSLLTDFCGVAWSILLWIMNVVCGRSGQMYYMFGFILLAFMVLLVVCAQTAVLLCYFHLCAEDYCWWWRSFFSTGTTALYLLFFSIHYFIYKTSITGALSYLLFFGYTFVMVFLFFIMTGEAHTHPVVFRSSSPCPLSTCRYHWLCVFPSLCEEDL